ncbi:MAG: hypothetical protein IJ958_02745 [Agathobacter sp.]|nr:hypothetical protein [Agathobacter sp.]
MKILDKILYQRLDRIRDELNSYIAEHAASINSEMSMSIPSPIKQHDTFGGITEKCLKAMPQPMSSARPVEIPDFLRSECQKRSIDEVLENKAETFSSMLLRLIDEKGLKDSEVYKKANIDRRLFSKIRGDEDYVPSKKTVISFCLALQLEMDEAKKLLEAAGYALSTASRFDLIIMYLIENKEYNIHFANIVLEDYGEGTLSK